MCDVCQGINSHMCPVCGESEPDIICQECNGTGAESYWAIDRRNGNEVEVNATAYMLLPDTQNLAESARSWYYKRGIEPCGHCNGTGYLNGYRTRKF